MELTPKLLSQLCFQYNYNIEHQDVVIFGIRGGLPLNAFEGNFKDLSKFSPSVRIKQTNIDYKNCRCSIGIWHLKSKQIAIFPGSTVPSIDYLIKYPQSKKTFNVLCPGFYELTRGRHPRNPNSFQQHTAFLMNGYGLVSIPSIKRQKFDFRDSSFEIKLPGDNLHAARIEADLNNDESVICKSTLNKKFSSSGCMVVVGQPKEYVKQEHQNKYWNCWEYFMELLSKLNPIKTNYDFLLFDYFDLEQALSIKTSNKIRYGSFGSQAQEVNNVLTSVIDLQSNQPYLKEENRLHFQDASFRAFKKFHNDFFNQKISFEIDVADFKRKTKHFTSSLKTNTYVIY